MKKTITAVTLALFVSALAGAASLSEFRIKAPQPFTVGGTALPAGAYSIQLMSTAGVLEVTNEDTHASVMVIGSPIGSPSNAQVGKVTFAAVGGKFTLSEIFLPNGASYGVPTRLTAR